MGNNAPLLYMALGMVFICLLIWSMTLISPNSDWEWIAPKMTAYIIILTMLGGSIFTLFLFLRRR